MQTLYKEFSNRPETASLIKPVGYNKDEPFYDEKKGTKVHQDVLKIDEASENSDNSNENGVVDEKEQKKILKLKKKLELIKQKNDKLQKDLRAMPRKNNTGCCIIF
mmetsp:Transcript_1291/g.1379  ORF Transcript_1291/g.1379 Transcript_1291/m.1379 type:complete len:106 (+) Transcript_1291:2385-2702(+)